MRLMQSPYSMDHHPLFRLDSRRVNWAWSPQRLRQYTWGILTLVHLALFAIWVLLLALYAIFTPGNNLDEDLVYNISLNIVSFVFFVIIAADVLLDFVSLQAAIKSINSEVLAGRWDLLRLTSLNERGIVAAKHAGVRLRVWRFTAIVASARAASVALWGFALFIAPWLVTGENWFVDDLLYEFQDTPFTIPVMILIVALTALIYVLEPFWRMQSMTALGMVLSAYITNIPLATLAAIGAMFAVWVLQVLVLLALLFGLGFGMSAVLAPFLFSNTVTMLPGFLYVLIACMVTAATIYGFYALLQTWSLRRVWYRIRKSN